MGYAYKDETPPRFDRSTFCGISARQCRGGRKLYYMRYTGLFVEERLHNLETADFDRIVRREVLRLEAALESAAALREAPGSTGFPILVFLHFPPAFGGTVSEEIVDVMKRYCVAHCYYGHIHGRYDIPPVEYVSGIPCSIVSADYLNFIPHIIK